MAITKGEQYFLDRIRSGDERAWSDFVTRYRGRLLRFARSKLSQGADAEDAVQETFIAFVRSIARYRGDCDLETYLFSLIRRKIIDSYRSAGARRVCLIQDTYDTESDEPASDPFSAVASPAQTASWYARADEQYDLQKAALAQGLSDLVDNLKRSLRFRDLQVIELLFYCQFPNKEVARTMNLNEKAVALIKHRSLKRIRENVAGQHLPAGPAAEEFENLLTDLWENLRFSCPKRSTIGAFMLQTLEEDWHTYVDFHLNVLGCRFCRANLDDLQSQSAESQREQFQARIMESTIGFLHRPL
ncbi:MAG: sigma-70 family RNA polymerase sigma factor [Sedimentisphaerales bacterium]|nr:sigma-70 family RNA polymerase sigma factor [Sedimentisphaerales bacterium]